MYQKMGIWNTFLFYKMNDFLLIILAVPVGNGSDHWGGWENVVLLFSHCFQ